jgi:hypothetical protein
VKLPSTGMVTWLFDTASEPDKPPQATRSVDKKQIQTIAIDACVGRFHTKAEAPERLQNFKKRYFILYRNKKNGDPEAAVRRDGVGAVTVRGSAVELFSDPGHGDQCDCSCDEIELQVAQPGQILQIGITQEVNSHQRYDDLVHVCLLHIAYPLNRRQSVIRNRRLSEIESASQMVGDMERVLPRI